MLLWLGIDEMFKVVLIVIGVFFLVYLNVVVGICDIDYKLIEVGISFGFSIVVLICYILLLVFLFYLFVGLCGGLSLVWMFLVVVELIVVIKGVGYLFLDGCESSWLDLVLVVIFIFVLLGKVSDSLLCVVE